MQRDACFIEHLQENLLGDVRLPDFGSRLGVLPGALCRLIKEHVGKPAESFVAGHMLRFVPIQPAGGHPADVSGGFNEDDRCALPTGGDGCRDPAGRCTKHDHVGLMCDASALTPGERRQQQAEGQQDRVELIHGLSLQANSSMTGTSMIPLRWGFTLAPRTNHDRC